jgi:hypothetical protein
MDIFEVATIFLFFTGFIFFVIGDWYTTYTFTKKGIPESMAVSRWFINKFGIDKYYIFKTLTFVGLYAVLTFIVYTMIYVKLAPILLWITLFIIGWCTTVLGAFAVYNNPRQVKIFLSEFSDPNPWASSGLSLNDDVASYVSP